MDKRHLHELTIEVMNEFTDAVFPEKRAFYVHPVPEETRQDGARPLEGELWWVQLICEVCESGYMERLTLEIPRDATDEWVKREVRNHIQTHIDNEHEAATR